MNFSNETTTSAPESDVIPVYWGYITLVIAILFYGTFLLPVKRYNTGDGMFFQLVLCMGIWTVSYVVNWIRDFPTFYALPMLGGVLFTTGNITSVPIIKFIGLALGMLIWGTTSLIIGWANARFGWFGIIAQIPNVVWMNYLGVALATLSGFTYVIIKSDVSKNVETNKKSDIELNNHQLDLNESENKTSFLDNLNPNIRRALGILLSIIAGVLYGLTYAPYTHVIDNYSGASRNGLDYVYSFYSGILVSSIFYFMVYAIFTKNDPFINKHAILPGFISGLMWGIANCSFLVANSSLSQTITFPIGASGPPMVATLVGILIFREIKGKKNLIILGIGFVFTISGAVITALSR